MTALCWTTAHCSPSIIFYFWIFFPPSFLRGLIIITNDVSLLFGTSFKFDCIYMTSCVEWDVKVSTVTHWAIEISQTFENETESVAIINLEFLCLCCRQPIATREQLNSAFYMISIICIVDFFLEVSNTSEHLQARVCSAAHFLHFIEIRFILSSCTS